jgi:hypothetical protein
MAKHHPPLDTDSTTATPSGTHPALPSRRDLLRRAVTIVAGAAVPLSADSTAKAVPALSASPTAEVAWQKLERGLVSALADLDEDDFIIVSSKRTNHFVQFVAQGSHGMRAEAVSNTYLDGSARLSRAASERLVALGWRAPTSGQDPGDVSPADIDGSSNFFVDATPPVPFAHLAQLGVASLREVYRVGHPGELQYDAGSTEDADVVLGFPALNLKRTNRATA